MWGVMGERDRPEREREREWTFYYNTVCCRDASYALLTCSTQHSHHPHHTPHPHTTPSRTHPTLHKHRYQDDYAAAVSANSEVGGDNASRAIAIGMVLGAAQGVEMIPAKWGPGHYVEWESSAALLDKAPLLLAAGSDGKRSEL